MRAPLAGIAGVVFDFDGTLTAPAAIDFVAMRSAIGCPAGANILGYIEAMPTAGQRRAALATVDAIELAAAAVSWPNPGAVALLLGLRARGVPLAVLTRNSLASVRRALVNFPGVEESVFTVIVTRDDPLPAKPAPDGVLAALRRLGVGPGEAVMVGDYRYDIEAGLAAGTRTVWLHHGEPEVPWRPAAEFAVRDLAELAGLFGLVL